MNLNKQWFQSNKKMIELIFLSVYFTINALINAITVLLQDMRGGTRSFLSWEPFVWELSSAYSTLLLFPVIGTLIARYGWGWHSPLSSLFRYISAAIVFSLLHVAAMVLLREFAYSFTTSDYQFATNAQTLVFELFYELQQDVWNFTFFILAIKVYQYALFQWLGDTKPIFQSSPQPEETVKGLPELLLVKKLGKEFLIKTKEVQWAESAGNYINLRIHDAVFPMRMTMADFAEQAKLYGFVRTHRSQIINAYWIAHIQKNPSGDADITMRDGSILKLSRRFKNDFETFISSLASC